MTNYRRLRNPRGQYDYIVAEDVPGRDIIFRNLKAGPTPFNPNNKDRTFALVIHDEEMAHALEDEGWKVKWFKQKNPDDEPTAFLTVKVQFHPVTPKIFLKNEDGSHTRIDERSIALFDESDILSAKIALNGRKITPAVGSPYPKPYASEMIIELAPSIFGVTDSGIPTDTLEIDGEDLPY